ncbi:MAG: hypothetical protein AMXMBFR53_34530 [Gemmatimonadota bacterium]
MHWTWKGIRRALGGPMSALVVMLSAAVPMLDVADLRTGTTVESQHDPASCAPSHDHTVCTQVGANHALAGRAPVRTPATFAHARVPLRTLRSVLGPVLADGHPTRAPPAV